MTLGESTASPPEGTMGCGFCKELPQLCRYTRNPHEGSSFKLKCVSEACANRVVETHRCGSEEAARDVWNAGRAAAE